MSSNQKLGRWNRPWLWLPSKAAHDLSPYLLPLWAKLSPQFDKQYRAWQWRGLTFDNPIGVAGGVDKTGACLSAWQKLGAGFLEVGTITPEPQEPNPGKIMDRDLARKALWNKMGFPNAGMEALARRLENFEKGRTPLFINIGKNRWTENDQAHEDYAKCVKRLHHWADVFVVNISSPNTKGLRDLLKKEDLEKFLQKLRSEVVEVCDKPFLLKLSPDMEEEVLKMALQVSAPYIDGWILTNTTKQRFKHSHFPEDTGGVSGKPLKDLSRKALKVAAAFKEDHPDKLLISVGGVGDAAEVAYRLDRGADLVQVYSGLVFSGPQFFRDTLQDLKLTTRLEK